MAELTKTERIRDALAPLIEKPTKHELNLVAQYKDCVTEYIANKGVTEREQKLKSNMNISNFAKLPNTTHSLHFGEGYSKLASSNEFLNDESLHFLQLYMKKLISPEDQEDVCFVRGVATNRLTKDARYAANGAGFPPKRTRRAKHCNDYLSLFANGRKGNEVPSVASYRSIFFPINFDNIHFAGAIAHVRDGDTIYTFDSMDKNQDSCTTHDDMYKMVSAVLNHALSYEGKEVRKFDHRPMRVPQQTDTWNCGLFQTANGIQLACADDPTAQAVMNALFKQSEIVKLRTKLPGIVLNECSIYSATKVKETFEKVTAQVDQWLEEAEKVEKKNRAKLSVTKNATGVEEIDLLNSDDEEEETSKPSSINKPPGTASAKSKHRTNTQASKQSQPLKQMQDQPSTTKQQSVPSLLKDDPSFIKAVSKNNVDFAFKAALKSACPMTFDNQESAERVRMLTQPWKDVLPVLSTGSTAIIKPEQVKKVHKSRASEADIERFCADLQCFMKACLAHCYQMVCFHDLATNIWSKITLSDTNDAFLKDFAKYLVHVLVYGWRANSYLDNGNNIVMEDKQLPQFCSDIIFNSDIKGRVMLLYPTLDYIKMRNSVVFSNLADVTSQTFSAIERQLIDEIIGNVNVVALTRNTDIVVATYQLSSGEQKSVRLESLFVTDSMDTYGRSQPSYPADRPYCAFRYSHLRHLHDLFMKADLKVPEYLMDNLRDMFNWSLEKRLIKRKQIHESSDEESSADESEAVKEKKNESATADCANIAADKGKKANDVETKNDSDVSKRDSDKNVEKDESPAPVGEKEKEANTASPTEEVVDKNDESAIKATKATGGGEKKDDAAIAKQVPKEKEESATKAKTVTFKNASSSTDREQCCLMLGRRVCIDPTLQSGEQLRLSSSKQLNDNIMDDINDGTTADSNGVAGRYSLRSEKNKSNGARCIGSCMLCVVCTAARALGAC